MNTQQSLKQKRQYLVFNDSTQKYLSQDNILNMQIPLEQITNNTESQISIQNVVTSQHYENLLSKQKNKIHNKSSNNLKNFEISKPANQIKQDQTSSNKKSNSLNRYNGNFKKDSDFQQQKKKFIKVQQNLKKDEMIYSNLKNIFESNKLVERELNRSSNNTKYIRQSRENMKYLNISQETSFRLSKSKENSTMLDKSKDNLQQQQLSRESSYQLSKSKDNLLSQYKSIQNSYKLGKSEENFNNKQLSRENSYKLNKESPFASTAHSNQISNQDNHQQQYVLSEFSYQQSKSREINQQTSYIPSEFSYQQSKSRDNNQQYYIPSEFSYQQRNCRENQDSYQSSYIPTEFSYKLSKSKESLQQEYLNTQNHDQLSQSREKLSQNQISTQNNYYQYKPKDEQKRSPSQSRSLSKSISNSSQQFQQFMLQQKSQANINKKFQNIQQSIYDVDRIQLNDQLDQLNSYEFHNQIGEGEFGKVYLAERFGEVQLQAIKVIDKTKMRQKKILKYAYSEQKILQESNHPFVIKLNNTFETDNNIYLVMNFCSGGNLRQYLQKYQRFSEQATRFFLCEIILAIQYLHSKNIVFRDLKPENIMIDQYGHIQICDFGLAKQGVESQNNGANSFCGSFAYLSPEMIQFKGHGKSLDWYQLGVIMYEMLVGLPPFYTDDSQQLLENIVNQELNIPIWISQSGQNLLKGLLNKDVEKRLGSTFADSEELKNHSFFSKIDWVDVLMKKYNNEIPLIHMTNVFKQPEFN